LPQHSRSVATGGVLGNALDMNMSKGGVERFSVGRRRRCN
jgi:hypothetical protein